MEIYFYLFFVIFIFSLFEITLDERSPVRKGMLFITYILSILVVGMRWRTGTDWEPYLTTFSSLDDSLLVSIRNNPGMEIGYLIFNWFVNLFSSNYSVFLVLHAAIYYYCILWGLAKVTKFPHLSFLLLFSDTLGVLGSNRQLLAVAIIFYAMTLAIERNKKYFLYVLMAMWFHVTAVITSIFYLLNKKISIKIILGSVLIAAIVGYSPLPQMIFGFLGGMSEISSGKVEVYANSKASATLGLLGMVRRGLFLVFFLLIRESLEKHFGNYNFFLNIFVCSLLIYLIFGSSLTILVNRGSLYFNIVQGVLLTAPLYMFKRYDTKYLYALILFALSFVFVYQSISTYADLFDPYQGIWYNDNFYRPVY
ncbi:EpsG family protein [Sphingobacterium oryzagri]|uniref:EpsG family protein n=1 Tax=Sphingobacterium oryzagri TaxID=3025669 RepID=A0ABY7WKP0_9SPHI|nr:EpsG family protein [Sphingobacterium sp. KACC 22765]WDF68968.1 EpsG family protein [Sphingobacterium sp. KACC 22765]